MEEEERKKDNHPDNEGYCTKERYVQIKTLLTVLVSSMRMNSLSRSWNEHKLPFPLLQLKAAEAISSLDPLPNSWHSVFSSWLWPMIFAGPVLLLPFLLPKPLFLLNKMELNSIPDTLGTNFSILVSASTITYELIPLCFLNCLICSFTVIFGFRSWLYREEVDWAAVDLLDVDFCVLLSFPIW